MGAQLPMPVMENPDDKCSKKINLSSARDELVRSRYNARRIKGHICINYLSEGIVPHGLLQSLSLRLVAAKGAPVRDAGFDNRAKNRPLIEAEAIAADGSKCHLTAPMATTAGCGVVRENRR